MRSRCSRRASRGQHARGRCRCSGLCAGATSTRRSNTSSALETKRAAPSGWRHAPRAVTCCVQRASAVAMVVCLAVRDLLEARRRVRRARGRRPALAGALAGEVARDARALADAASRRRERDDHACAEPGLRRQTGASRHASSRRSSRRRGMRSPAPSRRPPARSRSLVRRAELDLVDARTRDCAGQADERRAGLGCGPERPKPGRRRIGRPARGGRVSRRSARASARRRDPLEGIRRFQRRLGRAARESVQKRGLFTGDEAVRDRRPRASEGGRAAPRNAAVDRAPLGMRASGERDDDFARASSICGRRRAVEHEVWHEATSALSFLLAGSPSVAFTTTTGRPRSAATAASLSPVGNAPPPRPRRPLASLSRSARAARSRGGRRRARCSASATALAVGAHACEQPRDSLGCSVAHCGRHQLPAGVASSVPVTTWLTVSMLSANAS